VRLISCEIARRVKIKHSSKIECLLQLQRFKLFVHYKLIPSLLDRVAFVARNRFVVISIDDVICSTTNVSHDRNSQTTSFEVRRLQRCLVRSLCSFVIRPSIVYVSIATYVDYCQKYVVCILGHLSGQLCVSVWSILLVYFGMPCSVQNKIWHRWQSAYRRLLRPRSRRFSTTDGS